MPSNLQPILFLVVIAAVFYLLMIRPQQKKRKETQSMLQSLKPGSEIVTTAGMHGKVVALEPDETVLIEVAPGVTCRYMKQAVMRVVPEVSATPAAESLPEPSKDGKADDEETAAETEEKAETDETAEAKASDADTSDESDTADKDRRSSS